MTLLLVAVGTVLSYVAAVALGRPIAVPLLNTLPAFPAMLWWLRRGRMAPAVGAMLVWAAVMGTCATALAVLRPDLTGTLFINGEAYRREMFAWVRSGVGRESDPGQFLPQHAAHLATFGALSLATGGALAMPMGAWLMNYMGHYAGSLAFASERPWLVACAAWPPWALIRVASFVVIGVVLAGPVLARVGGFPFRLRDHGRWLGVAAGGLVAEVVLKWRLAPAWARWLRELVGW